MDSTLVIYELTKEYKKMRNLLFGLKANINDERDYVRLFEIVYPNSEKKEVVYYSTMENSKHGDLSREQTLQKVVNNLEDEGYYTESKFVYLFMQGKIDKLIMKKNKK